MNGRVAVITGGLGVLGSAVAALARAQGLKTAIIDNAPVAAGSPLEAADLVLGGVDLTDAAAAQGAIDAIVARLSRIDVLFNIAGGFRWLTLADSKPADWAFLYQVNVMTAVNASRAALPALRASGAGRIVNVGAGAAEKAVAGMGAYAAAKAGVHRLTESLADELKDHGVTVNAVLPTIIDTPQNRADMPGADTTRWVTPADLAEVMLFLASDAARPVTGALVRVPGRA